ncbi:MAG: hypothetical protein NT037_00685 [Hyphomicrobiales bacterium]|nr:hypothetical protein [Hyphomicrobiales bacterium]
MAYLVGRIASSVVLAFAVATIVFLALHLVPGDPAELLLSTGGISPDPAAVAELRERLGLDRPLHVQYLGFLTGLLRGDLGRSLVDDYSVASAGPLSMTIPLQPRSRCACRARLN